MKQLMESWQGFLKEEKIPELDSIAQELGIELRIYSDPSGILTLSKIVVPQDLRGQGLGSIAMEKIVQYADDNDKIIALTPDNAFGGSKTRLIKLYKQFGFVMNKGKNKNYSTRELMIREPSAKIGDIEEKKKRKKKRKVKKKKSDRCTRIAKRKYDVWPSAYASGAVVKCRQGKIWKGVKEAEETESIEEKKRKKKRKVKKKKAKTDYSKEKKDGLHGWFSRQGGKGKSKGWVDCNTCRKNKKTGRKTCKSCGRKDGEKRSKYPSCRPTPSACGTKGKGKKWGKKEESLEMKNEKNFITRVVAEILKDEQFRMLEAYSHISDAIYEDSYYYMEEASYDDGSLVEEDFGFHEILDPENIQEAEYQGRKVKLNKPMRGDVKKFKVYVNSGKKNKDGTIKVKKVNFGHGGTSAKSKGEKTMKIKKSNPKRRKAFRARHNCDSPGPKTKARYWSCRKW